jgi:hypothetical protein
MEGRMKNKCSCCGKFRKAEDLVWFDDHDGDGWLRGSWMECRFCLSQSDFETYFPGGERKMCGSAEYNNT